MEVTDVGNRVRDAPEVKRVATPSSRSQRQTGQALAEGLFRGDGASGRRSHGGVVGAAFAPVGWLLLHARGVTSPAENVAPGRGGVAMVVEARMVVNTRLHAKS